jgi:hypothetical protein
MKSNKWDRPTRRSDSSRLWLLYAVCLTTPSVAQTEASNDDKTVEQWTGNAEKRGHSLIWGTITACAWKHWRRPRTFSGKPVRWPTSELAAPEARETTHQAGTFVPFGSAVTDRTLRAVPAHSNYGTRLRKGNASRLQKGFESTMPVFERAMMARATDHEVTVIVCNPFLSQNDVPY